jgi:hypothetical protein
MTAIRSPSIYSEDDPISLALRPPLTESAPERQARLNLEAEALRISQCIDDLIRLDREKLKKSKTDIKVGIVLLLSVRIYLCLFLAPPPWSSRIRQEHFEETVPAHV